MGKTKGKIVKMGDKGCLKVKQDDGSWIQYDYDQPYSNLTGIVEGGAVTCELVKVKDVLMAVSVYPIDKGEIVTIDYEHGTGTIYEKESDITYTFFQNYLKESGFAAKDTVKYTIVNVTKDKTSVNYATCLVKPVPAG